MENQDFEKQIERCQALLEELETLSPEEGFDQIEELFGNAGLSAKPQTPLWVLLQELRIRQGQLALALDRHLLCLQVLAHCSWREANDLEAEAVRSCPSWPGGKDATVIKFGDGSFQIWSRRDSEVDTGRLSAELDVLLFEKIPWSVHNGLSQMRYLVEPESKARLMAKVAFEANGAGRPGLALGLLEGALNEGLEYPALIPSREALLKKGVVAESVAKSLLVIYQTEECWARPDRRVSLDTARRQAREFALARLGRSSSFSPDHDFGRWLLQAERRELELLLDGDKLNEKQSGSVLLFLEEWRPKEVQDLLPLCRDNPGLSDYYLQRGEVSKALDLLRDFAPRARWDVLYPWSASDELDQTDRSLLFSELRPAARRLLESVPESDEASLQAALWSLANDPEVHLWLGGCLNAALQAGRTLWAASLWLESAYCGQEELQEELCRFYPRILGAIIQGDALRALIEAAGPWNSLDQLVDVWKKLGEGPDRLPVETAIADLPMGPEWARQLSHSSDLERRRLAAAILRLTDHEALRAMGEVENDSTLREHIEESLMPVDPLQWEPPSSGEPFPGVLLEVFPRRGPRNESRSRVGGYPDLPPRTAWPEKSRFLMQIDLAELVNVELPDCSLPSQGLLSFFEIIEGGHKGENTALYFQESTRPTAPPLGAEVLPEAELRVRPTSLYPCSCFESGPEYEVMKPYDYVRGILGSSHDAKGNRFLLCDHVEIENSPFMDEFGFVGFVLCAVLGLDDRPGALVASELSLAQHLKRLLQREGETLALLLTGDMGVT